MQDNLNVYIFFTIQFYKEESTALGTRQTSATFNNDPCVRQYLYYCLTYFANNLEENTR